MSKTKKTIVSIISVLGLWVIYYFTLPTISIKYFGGFLYIAFFILVIVANITIWASNNKKNRSKWKPINVVADIIIAILIVGCIAGSTLFNANTMHQQLGNVEIIEYTDMIKQIDNSQIPIVDDELAKKQADKKIGEDIALGSRIDLGNVNIQEVNGEIVYVVPLEHSGVFKWKAYRTTPGYITVSASNPNKVNYVTELDGKKIEIRYQESAYFGNDLKRYIRNHGYRTVGLTEYTFELNDGGRPYWVVTTYENRTIWGNPEANGVVIVDAQTGEIEWHSLNDVPEWVDIIQPKDFVEDQIDNWGKLVHGVFNWSNEDKIKKTDLTLTAYVDGDCYYFTGMTSVGSDDSCVGFIMVNTRNKKATISYMSGATENAAMKSAEGLVSDFGYSSTEPLPLNVNGIPTYVMALKDKEGLIKSYAMINIKNYSIAAKGTSLPETSRAYMQAVTKSGSNQIISSDEAYGYTCEGIVERISSVVEDGSTCYYIVVEGEESKIFTASYLISDELSITRDGDKVIISYIDDKNGTVDITKFDNIAFSTPVSEEQQKRNELDESVSTLESDNNQIIEVNPHISEEKWNNLTEEEKAKMLKEFSEEE